MISEIFVNLVDESKRRSTHAAESIALVVSDRKRDRAVTDLAK